MKKLLVAACMLSSSTVARAELYTYEYTATATRLVTMILEGYQIIPTEVAALPTGTVRLGDSFTGRFSFDAAWTPTYEYGDDDWYSAAYYKTSLTSAVFAQGPKFESSNDYSLHAGLTGLELGSSSGSGFSEGVLVIISSRDGSTLTPGSLHDLPSFIKSAKIEAHYSYTTYPYTSVQAGGELTSLRLVSVVPEPTTYAMFAAGLGLLAWRRKRA
jgi:PEP-CTERM motif